MGTEWLDLWSERPELGLRSLIWSLRGRIWGLRSLIWGWKGLILESERLALGSEGLFGNGGGEGTENGNWRKSPCVES